MTIDFLEKVAGAQSSMMDTPMRTIKVNSSLATIGKEPGDYYIVEYTATGKDLQFMKVMDIDNAGNLFVVGKLDTSDLACFRINIGTGAVSWAYELNDGFYSPQLYNKSGVLTDGTYLYVSAEISNVMELVKLDYTGAAVARGTAANLGTNLALAGLVFNADKTTAYVGGYWNDGSNNIYQVVVEFDATDCSNVSYLRTIIGSDSYNQDLTFSNDVLFAAGYSIQASFEGIILSLDAVDNRDYVQVRTSSSSGETDAVRAVTAHSTGIYAAAEHETGALLSITKYQTDFTVDWDNGYSETDVDTIHDMVSDAADTVYVVGFLQPSFNDDGFIMAIDTNGNVLWERRINITLTGITIDPVSGDLFVQGYSTTDKGIICKFPSTGPDTGTYGAYTISALSLTTDAQSITNSLHTFNQRNATGTYATPTPAVSTTVTTTEDVVQI